MRVPSDVPLIFPDWPAPESVNACSTTRNGGVSGPPWDSLNLGGHVGDSANAVSHNRQRLADATGLAINSFRWLDQVHGTVVRDFSGPPTPSEPNRADAASTTTLRQPCTVLTADCLPVLFCDRTGTRVAAAHAGWRGLLAGILENTLATFDDPESVMCWLGPAIGPGSFEVGPEVRQAFISKAPSAADCFQSNENGTSRYLADIYELARQRLRAVGVTDFFGGDNCTLSEPETFFSFRRDGRTGRQASLIWLER